MSNEDNKTRAWIQNDTNNAHRVISKSQPNRTISTTKNPASGVVVDDPKEVAEIIADDQQFKEEPVETDWSGGNCESELSEFIVNEKLMDEALSLIHI